MKKGFAKIGYKWKNKQAAVWGDANEVGEALESIEERTPENILKAAKTDPRLKKIFFSSDDSEWAYKCRLQEARQLCAKLITVYQEKKTEEIFETKTYESVPLLLNESKDDDEEQPARMYINVVENLGNSVMRGFDSADLIINEIIKLQKQAAEKLSSLNDTIEKLI